MTPGIREAIESRPLAVAEIGVGDREATAISNLKIVMTSHQEIKSPYVRDFCEAYRIIQSLLVENNALRERIDEATAVSVYSGGMLKNALMKIYRQTPWLGACDPREVNSVMFR